MAEITWKKTVLDTRFRSEGVAVADVNRDGRPDVMAGGVWYEAPDWRMHEIRPAPEFDGATGYSNSFINYAMDVNGDGWPDLIVIGFPGEKAVWLENPRGGPGPWGEHLVWPSACNESPAFADIDGDGRPEPVFATDESRMAWYSPGPDPYAPWQMHPISEPGAPGTRKYAHGLGIGDVNGDGRPDVICRQGYWEGPADPRTGPWRFVPADLGPDCAHMLAYDVDGDGLADVISSSAHLKGLWWFQQRQANGGPEFTQHLIDESWSQSHALILADIDGDGTMDLVTGKRFWAHGPAGDVEADAPAVLYWYDLRREGGRVEWTRHLIDADSGVGTQFEVTDINGDGLPDIVTANKKGVFVFEQQRE
jgi:VCBS repeat protein